MSTPSSPSPSLQSPHHPVDIPTLTDVVQVPGHEAVTRPQGLEETNQEEETDQENHRRDLPGQVTANVLDRLLNRSDTLLEAQLQNALAPLLAQAAESIVHDLHGLLKAMIRDAVTRAVTEELARLQAGTSRSHRSTRPT